MSRWQVWVDGICSVVAVCGFALIGACLVRPDPGAFLSGGWSEFTIYPWWTLALVDAGLAAGSLALLVGAQGGPFAALPGVTAVVGAQLAGLGFVAAGRWGPASGAGGPYPGGVDQLERLALVIGVTGVGIVLVSLAQLVLRGHALVPSPAGTRRLAAIVGTGLLLLLPLAIGLGARDDLGSTTLGAYALAYSAPWGLAVVVSGWLSREAAAAALVACAAGALLAAVGPQLGGLTPPDPWRAFSLAGAAAVLTLLVRLRPVRSRATGR